MEITIGFNFDADFVTSDTSMFEIRFLLFQNVHHFCWHYRSFSYSSQKFPVQVFRRIGFYRKSQSLEEE